MMTMPGEQFVIRPQARSIRRGLQVRAQVAKDVMLDSRRPGGPMGGQGHCK
jgi:hypothetical protein